MSSDEISRGAPNQPNRKPTYNSGKSYNNSNPNYNYGNSMYNGNSNTGYSGQQQHPRRRVDRYKRESLNVNERLLKQNDMIIRLLKEIRDRLPAPDNACNTEMQDQGQNFSNNNFPDESASGTDPQVESDKEQNEQAEISSPGNEK